MPRCLPLLLALALASHAFAQYFPTPHDDYAKRRDALFAHIGDKGVVVLPGAPEPDRMDQFKQYNDFYYLTGVEMPDAALLLDGAKRQTTLFLPERNPSRETWTGIKLGPGQRARELTGISMVLPSERFEGELKKAVGADTALYLPRGVEEHGSRIADVGGEADAARRKNPFDGRDNDYRTFSARLAERFPGRKVLDVTRVIRALRVIKSDHEAQLLRRAAAISAAALKKVMGRRWVGFYEYQMSALLQGAYLWEGARGYAYAPIVGSGFNATILHYLENTRKVEDNELILIDSAAWYQYYTSDITRTFPANGRFTERQKELYQIVLDAQKAALRQCKPGSTLMVIHGAAQRVIAQAGYGAAFLHGTSHYLGMAVHDPGPYAGILKPGMVFTVEPGIYLSDEKIGIRIEDVVLITETGYENLTADCPKEIAEIEALSR